MSAQSAPYFHTTDRLTVCASDWRALGRINYLARLSVSRTLRGRCTMRITTCIIRGWSAQIQAFWHLMGCKSPSFTPIVCNGSSKWLHPAQACLGFDGVQGLHCQIMADQEDDTESQSAKKRKRSGPRSRTSSYLGVTRVSHSLAPGFCRTSKGRCFYNFIAQHPHVSRR